MKRRRNGSIELRNGVFRARKRVDGRLVPVGNFATLEEAEATLAVVAEGLAAVSPTAGDTLASWGAKWLDKRELDGIHRNVPRERYVWRRILSAPFSGHPLVEVTVRDVRDWVNLQLREKAERRTVAIALSLLRGCLEGACEDGLLERNVAREVRVPKVASTKEKWTWLRAEEITKLLGDQLAEETRDIFAVAIYTGLRAGELFGLEWADVDLPRATALIRHSWKGSPTKRGETRNLHLFAPVVDALQRQRARSGKHRHVFPDASGNPRSKDQAPRLSEYLPLVGIKRHARFHDLRHTGASHLISGSWGRAWTLEEVAKHLGHSTSATTRRYAHLCPEGLAKAARETRPELYSKPVALVPRSPQQARGAGAGPRAKSAESAEGMGFEPTVPLRAHRISNPAGSATAAAACSTWGTRGERAMALLDGLRGGSTTQGAVAELAAEVLTNPPPIMAAAQRFLAALGAPDEGMAAVAFLELAADLAERQAAMLPGKKSEGPG